MIYPRGAAISINLRTLLPEECVAIATNRDTSLVAVITKSSLFVLQAEVSSEMNRCKSSILSSRIWCSPVYHDRMTMCSRVALIKHYCGASTRRPYALLCVVIQFPLLYLHSCRRQTRRCSSTMCASRHKTPSMNYETLTCR